MKKILYTLIYSGLLGLVVNCTANMEKHVADKEGTISDIELQFYGEALPKNNLLAFEQRALQKLEDFYGYLNIIADSTYDTAFRQYSRSLAVQLFDHQTQVLWQGKSYSIEQFVSNWYSQSQPGKFALEQPKVTKGFGVLRSGAYFATLAYTIHTNGAEHSYTTLMKTEVVVKKTVKHFGHESKPVWEAFLGDTYPEE